MPKRQINDDEKQMWVDITSLLVQQMEEDLAVQADEFEYGESDEVKLNARTSAEADMDYYTQSLEELQEAADARGELGPLDADVIRADRMSATDWNDGNMVENLINDMVSFFFEPNEHNAVHAQLDFVGCGFLYSDIRKALLEYMDWTENDLPDRGYDGKAQKIKEDMIRNGTYVKEDWQQDFDQDYLEIVKGVKDAAADYNHEVANATRNGIKITTSICTAGMIRVAKAHMDFVV